LLPSLAQAQTTFPKPVGELTYFSATALAKALRDKQVSSEEVVNAYLRRIEAVNPKLNAVVQLTAEAARAQAREADTALARGELKGPLHGVPFTVKDTIETAGVICAAGTKGRAAFVPAQDATAVARLRAAGAILLGKTNVSELGLISECDNLVYGRTNNPYDVSRIPGGSSGGEAAILATGASPLGLGSQDIGLSAHCCGIAGVKPTTKRVPMTGHFPLPTFGVTSHQQARGGTMWQIGPMARFVEDLSLILPLLAGEDGLDPNTVTMPLGNPRTVELKSLRVAFYTDNEVVSPTSDTVATVQAAAKALVDAGLAVEESRPERLKQSYELFLRLTFSEPTVRWVEQVLEKAGTTEPPLWTQWLMKTAHPNKRERGDLRTLAGSVTSYHSSLFAFLEKYDVILCPVSPAPAPARWATPSDAQTLLWSYLAAYAMTELPTVVVRAGASSEGLPIGVQIVAREWREDVALAVAQRLQTVLGGWQPPQL
jgi:amidase